MSDPDAPSRPSRSPETAAERLTRHIDDWYRSRCGKLPASGRFVRPLIQPPFRDDECRDFLDGLDAGLFSIDDRGYYQTPLLQKFPMFLFKPVGTDGRAEFMRESITNIAAACALVLTYGWPAEQVGVPSPGEALDVIVTDGLGHVLICAEAKTRSTDLDALLAEVTSCELDDSCRNPHHKKVLGLRRERPRHFWAVAPGDRRVFRIESLEPRISLVPAGLAALYRQLQNGS